MKYYRENPIPKLTKEQAVIISVYTGVLCAPFDDVHQYIEEKMGRPVFTHEIPLLDLKTAAKDDFFLLLTNEAQK